MDYTYHTTLHFVHFQSDFLTLRPEFLCYLLRCDVWMDLERKKIFTELQYLERNHMQPKRDKFCKHHIITIFSSKSSSLFSLHAYFATLISSKAWLYIPNAVLKIQNAYIYCTFFCYFYFFFFFFFNNLESRKPVLE